MSDMVVNCHSTAQALVLDFHELSGGMTRRVINLRPTQAAALATRARGKAREQSLFIVPRRAPPIRAQKQAGYEIFGVTTTETSGDVKAKRKCPPG